MISTASTEPEQLASIESAPTADATKEKGRQKKELVEASPVSISSHAHRKPKPIVKNNLMAKYKVKKVPEPQKSA